MKEVLFAGGVDDLAAVIRACQVPAESLFLVETLPLHVVESDQERENLLHFANFDGNIQFEQYTFGRIFHHDFELRWEKDGRNTQVIYTGVERALPMLAPVRNVDLARYQHRHKQYYLFGKRLRLKELQQIGIAEAEGYFAEVRIPRLLSYPIASSDKQRIRLTVREYIVEATGKVAFFRFQGIEPGGKNDESL